MKTLPFSAGPRIGRRYFMAAIASAGASMAILAPHVKSNAQLSAIVALDSESRTNAENATPAASEVFRLRLTPGIGNNWCFYTGSAQQSNDMPAEALISAVKNATDEPIRLTFQSTRGDHVGPVGLSFGQSSDTFSGISVLGFWKAEVSGTEAAAPSVIVLEITFKVTAIQSEATPGL